MKNLRSRLCASLVLFFCGTVVPAEAQQEDNGSFYFPPEFSFILQSGSGKKAVPDGMVWNEYRTYNTAPLLPIVFFDAGDAQPAKRYQLFFNSLETDAFMDSNGVAAATEAAMQHQVLNIIGYRMRELFGTTIELEGGYSTEPGESARTAAERAKIVKEYLVNIWKIEPERITLLPSRRMCDSADQIFRQEEARCVLIHPNDIGLIRSVQFYGDYVNTPSIDFALSVRPNTAAPDDVASIDIILQAGDTVLSRTKVDGHPDSGLYRLQGLWAGPRDLLTNVEQLEAYAVVNLQNGLTRRANSVLIPVRRIRFDGDLPKTTTDSTFEVYLPFFFPGQVSISPLQQSLLGDALASILTDTVLAGATFDLSIRAFADASEDTTTPSPLLYSLWSEYHILSNRLGSVFQNMPKLRPLIFRNAEGQVKGFDVWLYGDEASSITENYQRRSLLTNSALGNEGKAAVDSLSMWRGEEVAAHLRSHIESGRFKKIHVRPQPDSREESSDSPPYYFHPEERFYQRRVIIAGRLHHDDVSDGETSDEK